MKFNQKLLGMFLVPLLAAGAFAQQGSAPTDQRVESLLAQMTLDEKIGQMVQVDMMALKD